MMTALIFPHAKHAKIFLAPQVDSFLISHFDWGAKEFTLGAMKTIARFVR